MPQAHRIEWLEFDIGYPSEAEARAASDRLGDFAAARALQVIGEVFDDFIGDARVLRLDRLEVDLGSAPASEVEFEAGLREALRSALESAAPQARWAAGSGAGVATLSGPQADLQALQLWLTEGRLPWTWVRTGRVETDALVARVLDANGAALAAALRSAPDRSRLLARLARQWADEHKRQLLDLLSSQREPDGGRARLAAPAEADPQAWARILAQALGDGPVDRAAPALRPGAARAAAGPARRGHLLLQEPAAARAALRRLNESPEGRRALTDRADWSDLMRLWASDPVDAGLALALAGLDDAPLPLALGERGQARRALAGVLLDHMFVPGLDGLDLAALAPSLVARAASLAGAQPAVAARLWLAEWPLGGAARLNRLLADLLDPDSGDRPPVPASAPLRDPVLRAVRSRLDMRLADAALDDDAWTLVFERDPAWLASRLRRYGLTAAWRRSFARRLSDDHLTDLLALWLPRSAVEPLKAVLMALEAWTLQSDEPPQAIALLLRQWLLAALLLADGERIDAAAVLEVLARARARHDDLDFAVATRAVAAALPGTGPAARLRDTLASLAARLDAPSPDDPLEAPSSAHRAGTTEAVALALADGPGPAIPDGPLSADWIARLPQPLPPELARAITQALLATPVGPLTEVRRRDAGPPGAGGSPGPGASTDEPPLEDPQRRGDSVEAIVGRLSRAWSASGLPPPASGWSAFNAAVLSVAREPGSAGFEEQTFTAAWLRARLAEFAPVSDQPEPGRAPDMRPASPPHAQAGGDRAGADPQGGEIAPPPGAPPGDFTAAWLARAPRRPSPALARAWAEALTPAARGRARIRPLAEAERRDLFTRIEAREGPAILGVTDRLAAAWTRAGLPSPAEGLAERTWRFLLTWVFEQGRGFDAQRLAAGWCATLTEDAPPSAGARARTALAAELWPDGDNSSLGGLTEIDAQIARGLGLFVGPSLPPAADMPDQSPAGRLSAHQAGGAWALEGEAGLAETIYLDNAGLVLAGAYIPMLFDRLGLTEGRAFKGPEAAERGAQLLQVLVDGDAAAPDHQLALNKILCGLELAWPLERHFEATALERETIESLLRAMIERWSIIGRTSVAGLRESFLRRPGALAAEPEAWRLQVEPRAFDMLLDQIPWGYRTLKLPWMAQVMHVDWR